MRIPNTKKKKTAATAAVAVAVAAGSVLTGAGPAAAWGASIQFAAVDGRSGFVENGIPTFRADGERPTFQAIVPSDVEGTVAFRAGSTDLCSVPVSAAGFPSCAATSSLQSGTTVVTAEVRSASGAVLTQSVARVVVSLAPRDVTAVRTGLVTTITGVAQANSAVHAFVPGTQRGVHGITGADGRFTLELTSVEVGEQLQVWDGAAVGWGAGPKSTVTVTGDDGQQPEPIVADPHTGVVDAGFTPTPVVATPGPGVVDAGFTPTPGQSDTELRDLRAEWDADTGRLTVSGTGAAGTSVEIRWGFSGHAVVPTDADGRFTYELDHRVDTVTVAATGSSDVSYVSVTDRPTAPPVDVATPNPGTTDPGFTVGTGDGEQQPEPIVATPEPGGTDPGLTAGSDAPWDRIERLTATYDVRTDTTTISGVAPAGARVAFVWTSLGGNAVDAGGDGTFEIALLGRGTDTVTVNVFGSDRKYVAPVQVLGA